MPRHPVPRCARWLLWRLAEPAQRDDLLAALDDEAAERAAVDGAAAARRWSRSQVWRSLLPLAARRLEAAAFKRRGTRMAPWHGFTSDLMVAIRRLGEARGFTLVCVLTLALGIGGNTAVFTLIDRVMFEPLPVPRPQELHRVGETDACCVNGGLQGNFSLFSYDLYTHLRDAAAPAFTALAAVTPNPRTFTVGRPTGDAPPETLIGSFVSGNYFQALEVTPGAGRLLQPGDDRKGAAPVAVISHRAWIERFEGRADAVGRAVTINGVAATIVGVAPEGFYGETLRPNAPDVWAPLSAEPVMQPAARLLDRRATHWLYAIGRMRSDASAAAVQTQLTGVLRQWLTTIELSPADRQEIARQHIAVIPAAAGIDTMRQSVAPSLRLLQTLAGALLLLACANLAGLLLARGSARRAETAMRVALGASRPRLIGQFLLEALLLSSIGGVLGLAISFVAARTIVGMAFRGATNIPVEAWPSPLAVGFALAAAIATGLLFGTLPAIVGSRSDPVEALRTGSRGIGDRGGRLRASLISLQVAVSLVLVTCAALLGRSLHALEAQDFGFRQEGRYVVSLAPSMSLVPPGELPALYARIQERLEQVPGVASAAFSLYAPMSGDNWSARIAIEGRDPTDRPIASFNRVTPRYFETIGTPLLRGRVFNERDTRNTPLVAIVTQSFAKRFFGDVDPVGRRIGQSVPEIEIVGVVGDAKYQDGRRAPRETFFLPFLQETAESRARAASAGIAIDRSQYPQAIELQARGVVADLDRQVRIALADIDRRLTVRSVVTLEEQTARAFNLDRLIARLTAAFGGVALLLACLGLYGATAFSVARRTREIGVRMAVGAGWTGVVATVVRGPVVQVAIGAAIGVPAALVTGRYLESQLFGIGPRDPWSLAGAALVLGAAAAVAALLPAARAARMDPVRALRVD